MGKLHEIWPGKMKGRIYCGAAALCAITGLEGHDVRAYINTVRRRPLNQAVIGMSNHTMASVLDLLGVKYRVINVKPYGKRSLYTLQKLLAENPKLFGIVALNTHYVAVNGLTVADNWHRLGGPVDECPHRRRYVEQFYEITYVPCAFEILKKAA